MAFELRNGDLICGTCTVCSNSKERGKNYTRFGRREVSDLMNDGCLNCTVIWKAVGLYYCWNEVDSVMVQKGGDSVALWPGGYRSSRGSVTVGVGPGSVSPSPMLGIIPNPILGLSFDHKIQTIKTWLRHCHANHTLCKPHARGNVLPTRLIDVGHSTQDPRLYKPEKKELTYIALSHCWGLDNPKAKRLVTTVDSIVSHETGIALERFPQTFIEAILVTRALGIKYLWIDSLCIIQDDLLDWAVESSRMKTVYEEAFLTIAADRSAFPDSGLFPNEEEEKEMRRHFVLSEPVTREEHRVYARKRVYDSEEYYESIDIHRSFCYASDTISLLKKRAWVLQEQVLSPRIVHFTSTELIWECNQDSRCQCNRKLPQTQSPKAAFIQIRDPSQDQPTYADFPQLDSLRHLAEHITWSRKDTHFPIWYGHWEAIVSDFSARDITYLSDRLPALSGLAAATGRPSSDYLAGLWRQELPWQLLWSRKQAPLRRHKTYYAPSWSWASQDGPIDWIYRRGVALLWKITDTLCSPESLNPYGPLSLGWIDVVGPLIPLPEHARRGSFTYSHRIDGKTYKLENWGTYLDKTDFSGSISWRAATQQSHLDLFLLFGAVTWTTMWRPILIGLVIKPCKSMGSENCYERVCLAELHLFSDNKDLLGWHSAAKTSKVRLI